MLFGNIFVYFQFRGEAEISESSRLTVYGVLAGMGVAGVLLLAFLKGRTSLSEATTSPGKAFSEFLSCILYSLDLKFSLSVTSVLLFKRRDVLLLSLTFFYTGIAQSFFTGIYGTAIGNTKIFGSDAQKLIGLSGMLIGVGEIAGGAAFGIFGSKTFGNRRDAVILTGFLVHMAAFISIYINLPAESSKTATQGMGHIDSSLTLALCGSFMLGFGDACFITQIMSFLGSVFADDSAPIFALFKFVQSIATAMAFLYSDYIDLYIHIYILATAIVIGTLSFCQTEWTRREKEIRARTHLPTSATSETLCEIPDKID